MLATKGESAVCLDVGKAAEPGVGGSVREAHPCLYITHAHHHVVHCKYVQFLKQMTKELLSKSSQCCPGCILLPSDLGWRASISPNELDTIF